MTATPPFRPGQKVVCADDRDGAHFLRVGQTYEVLDVQRGADGVRRVCLVGMMCMWGLERFRPAGAVHLERGTMPP